MDNFQDPQELTKSPHRKFYSTLFPFTYWTKLNSTNFRPGAASGFGYSIRDPTSLLFRYSVFCFHNMGIINHSIETRPTPPPTAPGAWRAIGPLICKSVVGGIWNHGKTFIMQVCSKGWFRSKWFEPLL